MTDTIESLRQQLADLTNVHNQTVSNGIAGFEAIKQQLAECQACLARTQNSDEHNFNRWQQETERTKELTAEVERLKSWEKSAWQRGHSVGINGLNSALNDISKAKDSYLDENQRLTELLLTTEDQLAELTAQRDNLNRLCEFNEKTMSDLVCNLEAAMNDAERYRWLRSEHAVNYPMAAVVWKRNYDRKESEWVNTSDVHSLDRSIDAAIAKCKEPGV